MPQEPATLQVLVALEVKTKIYIPKYGSLYVMYKDVHDVSGQKAPAIASLQRKPLTGELFLRTIPRRAQQYATSLIKMIESDEDITSEKKECVFADVSTSVLRLRYGAVIPYLRAILNTRDIDALTRPDVMSFASSLRESEEQVYFYSIAKVGNADTLTSKDFICDRTKRIMTKLDMNAIYFIDAAAVTGRMDLLTSAPVLDYVDRMRSKAGTLFEAVIETGDVQALTSNDTMSYAKSLNTAAEMYFGAIARIGDAQALTSQRIRDHVTPQIAGDFYSIIVESGDVETLTSQKVMSFASWKKDIFYKAIAETGEIQALTNDAFLKLAESFGSDTPVYLKAIAHGGRLNEYLLNENNIDRLRGLLSENTVEFLKAVASTGRAEILTSGRILNFISELDEKGCNAYLRALSNGKTSLLEDNVIRIVSAFDKEIRSRYVEVLIGVFISDPTSFYQSRLTSASMIEFIAGIGKTAAVSYLYQLARYENYRGDLRKRWEMLTSDKTVNATVVRFLREIGENGAACLDAIGDISDNISDVSVSVFNGLQLIEDISSGMRRRITHLNNDAARKYFYELIRYRFIYSNYPDLTRGTNLLDAEIITAEAVELANSMAGDAGIYFRTIANAKCPKSITNANTISYATRLQPHLRDAFLYTAAELDERGTAILIDLCKRLKPSSLLRENSNTIADIVRNGLHELVTDRQSLDAVTLYLESRYLQLPEPTKSNISSYEKETGVYLRELGITRSLSVIQARMALSLHLGKASENDEYDEEGADDTSTNVAGLLDAINNAEEYEITLYDITADAAMHYAMLQRSQKLELILSVLTRESAEPEASETLALYLNETVINAAVNELASKKYTDQKAKLKQIMTDQGYEEAYSYAKKAFKNHRVIALLNFVDSFDIRMEENVIIEASRSTDPLAFDNRDLGACIFLPSGEAKESIIDYCTDPRGYLIRYAEEGRTIGAAVCVFSEGRLFVNSIEGMPVFNSKGIFEMVYEDVLSRARSLGLKEVCFNAAPYNNLPNEFVDFLRSKGLTTDTVSSDFLGSFGGQLDVEKGMDMEVFRVHNEQGESSG